MTPLTWTTEKPTAGGRMSEQIIAEHWPLPVIIEEELKARQVPLDAFLKLTGITSERWAELYRGEKGALLSESERIAGALHINMQFIVNLNHSYMQWREDKP